MGSWSGRCPNCNSMKADIRYRCSNCGAMGFD